MTRKILYSAALLIFGIAATGSNISAQVKIRLPQSAKVLKRENIRIAPLNEAAKLEQVNEALKAKNLPKATGSTSFAKFSAENPNLSADNYLAYIRPVSVMFFGGNVHFSASTGVLDSSLTVAFKPPAAGSYLLDLSVKQNGVGAPTFTLSSLDSKNMITKSFPQQAAYVHVIFVLTFVDTSPQAISIFADQDWLFFACDISQIK